MVVLNAKLTTSIMQKNYSNCPLKKRPVQYFKEEVLLPIPKIEKKESEDITEPENLSTKPEDLSKTGRYPKTISPPAESEQYPKVLTPPEEEYRRDSPSEYYSTPVIKSAFQPLHLNNQSEFFQARWNPQALVPRPYSNFIQPSYAYHYDGYSYMPPLLQLSPTRSIETFSPYARESSCSPPSVDYITKVRGHNVGSSARYRPFSVASLSPTSSDNSFQSNSPPLEEPTPEDLSSPLSDSLEPAIIPEKKRKDKIERYNCTPCGKSYSTYSGLTKHQQYHCPAVDGNLVKKSFSCKFCQKVYTSLGALKMHIRTHTLPCKCHMCGKAFSRPWLLQGHIRTHTGEKPFSCQHCNRAFADRSNLRAHLQTHSDIKKYSCTTCSKTFSRMSLLTKHNDGGCPGNGPQIQSYPSSSEILVY